MEPSARVYALRELENGYVDSLGTPQASLTFFIGRTSAGLKLAYPFAWSEMIALTPYAGLYDDYYFTADDIKFTGVDTSVRPFLNGWPPVRASASPLNSPTEECSPSAPNVAAFAVLSASEPSGPARGSPLSRSKHERSHTTGWVARRVRPNNWALSVRSAQLPQAFWICPRELNQVTSR